MKLQYQDKTGLFPEHDSLAPLTFERLRLTIPAYEALLAAGAAIAELGTDQTGGTVYGVQIDADAQMPAGLVACRIIGTSSIGVRLETEPEYPGETPTFWEQVDFSPCPECGAPLIWYEAGYVPGYRVCGRPPHHHVLVQLTGSSKSEKV